MPEATANQSAKAQPATACGDVPELTRLRYFHGRALGALDLRREQAYHLDKARLRNRLLHGWGIVCGLHVDLVAKAPCDPDDDAPQATVLTVSPGAAIDSRGNEIVVRNPREVSLDALLSDEELRTLRAWRAEHPAGDGSPTVYLTLHYHEQLLDPTRPLLAAECEPVPGCEYGRVCETYRICATTTRPDTGPECEPCCGGRGDGSVLLAAIYEFDPDTPIGSEQLHLGARRPLAVHDLTEIVAVSWVHGATYSREAAKRLLERLEVTFSRPVQVASLHRDVVELTTIEGGGGRSGGVYSIQTAVDNPAGQRLTRRLSFRSTSDETLQFGDRVLITLRGDFIIDECSRAVDANHVAGSVPTSYNPDHPQPTRVPDAVHRRRRSGNGSEGGEFVSWFRIEERRPT